ncbi:chain length determinant protein tyrosine kinase EpsG [Sphaerotilus sulfidivorans]|jgi:chain length determinant protein tyrosine kinase EpsG
MSFARPKEKNLRMESSMTRADETALSAGEDRCIGDLIREKKSLSEQQIEAILAYQRDHGVRFGEAAVALGLATDADVVFALSQQFHYPYTPEDRRHIHPELVTATQPFGPRAEAFRAIRSQLMMRVFSPIEPRRAMAVVSPDSGDGRSYFVANLGIVLAQLGGRTLIMDANFRSPRQHELFGVPNAAGLSGILSGRQEENVIYQAADIPSLFVMPVGILPPNPLELLERPAFRLLVGELLRKFDHVIVDTPPASSGSDAAVIASRCGAALVVSRKNKTRMASLNTLVDSMVAASAKLAGVVLNEH